MTLSSKKDCISLCAKLALNGSGSIIWIKNSEFELSKLYLFNKQIPDNVTCKPNNRKRT